MLVSRSPTTFGTLNPQNFRRISHHLAGHLVKVKIIFVAIRGHRYFTNTIRKDLVLKYRVIHLTIEKFQSKIEIVPLDVQCQVQEIIANLGKGLGWDQVSGGVSVPCWHHTPVANALWKLKGICSK